jgi:hypothetical protein
MVDHGLTINHGFWLVFGQTMVFSTIAALCFGGEFFVCVGLWVSHKFEIGLIGLILYWGFLASFSGIGNFLIFSIFCKIV